MPTNLIMPQLGESVVEGTISRWLKNEGDRISEYDPIVEVNTDKVDTEIPAPATGVVLKILVAAGTTVKAGTTLAIIGDAGENQIPTAKSQSPISAPLISNSPTPVPTPVVKRDLGFISPVVMKLANEYSIDLQLVEGTGDKGRITKKDVMAFIEKRGSASTPTAPAEIHALETPVAPNLHAATILEEAHALTTPSVVRPSSSVAEDFIPVVGMRKSIAEHMVKSERTAPHVTTVMEVDLTKVLAHLDANSATFAKDGVKLTLTAYFVQATVAALKAVPLVNSQWAEDKIILKRDINIGMAVALEEGLIVPVIKNADEKSLLGVARTVNDLAKRARAKALKPEEVSGGTFTITNHGVSGSLFATPIINQPQTGILGVGVMQKRVVVISQPGIGDTMAIRPMAYVSLTFDHRILDGALGDKCLMTLKKTLENWA